jgi:hypothetical protein
MEPGREALTLSRDSISFQKHFSRRHLYRLLRLGHTKPHSPSQDVEMRIMRRRDHARRWPRSPFRGRRTRCVENARHRQAYHVALRAKAPLEELSVRHFCLLSHIRRLMYPNHGPWVRSSTYATNTLDRSASFTATNAIRSLAVRAPLPTWNALGCCRHHHYAQCIFQHLYLAITARRSSNRSTLIVRLGESQCTSLSTKQKH